MKSFSSATTATISIRQVAYSVLVLLALVTSVLFLYYGMTEPDWHDFDVFYGAAKAALSGQSIYIVTGEFDLPFWYFPWTAWFYIPFAVWPKEIALILYKFAFVACAVLGTNSLIRYYNPDFKPLDTLLLISLIIPMSFQGMIVGQMEFILLALIIITMYAIDRGQNLVAGLIFPFLWTKPHLLIIFTLIAFWRGGKRLVAVSALASIVMLGIQTLISPGWHLEMLRLLQSGQERIDGLKFTTFPSLLGSQENWIGTANLPLTILLILLALVVVWRFRSLPTVPLLSLALAASLFCAPRAYAYDLPMLIPLMVWLTAKNFKSTYWIWLVAAILPPALRFGSATYLLTVSVFLWGIWKAYQETQILKTNG